MVEYTFRYSLRKLATPELRPPSKFYVQEILSGCAKSVPSTDPALSLSLHLSLTHIVCLSLSFSLTLSLFLSLLLWFMYFVFKRGRRAFAGHTQNFFYLRGSAIREHCWGGCRLYEDKLSRCRYNLYFKGAAMSRRRARRSTSQTASPFINLDNLHVTFSFFLNDPFCVFSYSEPHFSKPDGACVSVWSVPVDRHFVLNARETSHCHKYEYVT